MVLINSGSRRSLEGERCLNLKLSELPDKLNSRLTESGGPYKEGLGYGKRRDNFYN